MSSIGHFLVLCGLAVGIMNTGCTPKTKTVHAPDKGLFLVEDGQARAVVVTADEPSAVAAYAAKELIEHVALGTGVRLQIVGESQATIDDGRSRIYVGATQAAAGQGIVADRLPADAFVLRSAGRDLYIVGLEEDGDLFASSARRGTLYGVYEVLERHVGVRWLWPGELGTFVPPAATVRLPGRIDERVEPAFRFRSFRTGRIDQAVRHYEPALERLAFSPTGLQAYAGALRTYLVRQRLGATDPKPPVGHYFSGWWEQYGAEHPEWFMMREDGQRGPGPGASESERHHVAMCVSNPDLHRFIVEEVWDGGDILRLGEVDRRVFCQCPDCLSWDVPGPEPPPDFALNMYRPLVSDRYARFWTTIRDMAAQRNPDVLVTTFLYWNYQPAPIGDIRLDGVYGEFVPWGQSEIVYYPMEEEAHTWNKEQWQGWAERGVTMGYRPNYLLGGYVMPHLSTWQAGDMFQFAARHGMIGFDFDSLWSHWAVKGPMYYLHMRLSVHPEHSIETLRREYFAAFGPAAAAVEEYFDHWEEYSRTRAAGGGVSWSDPTRANELYPPEVFVPAARRLDEAMELARQDARPEYAERIRFLQAGLEHARLSARFIGTLGHRGAVPTDDAERFQTARNALQELIDFRRANEHLYIADYVAAATVENRRIDISTLLEASFDAVRTEPLSNLLEDPFDPWYFRKDPADVGVDEEWYSADRTETAKGLRHQEGEAGGYAIDTTHWTPVAVPARLGETPVGAYLGYGWYATLLSIPADWRGETVGLRFQGVDEQAWVYLNGEYVGEHTTTSENLTVGELWERPFTIKVDPSLVRPGQPNLLVVRTHASTGAAGIWGPVQVYTADAGE